MIYEKERTSMGYKTREFLKRLWSGEVFTKKLLCPAKINLFLEVTGRREDGYHTIESVMQKISLCDRVELTLSRGEGISITSNDRTLPTGEKNLGYRAITSYLAAAGITLHADLYIYKRIPVAAGLAGGSTDAAGVLRALDGMIGALSKKQLAEIALSLGADVPFCLFASASLCRGLGEERSFITPLADCCLVVAKSKRESVSTPEAYRLIDSLSYEPVSVKATEEALAREELGDIAQSLFNRFEEVIEDSCPSVSRIKKIMLEGGALRAMMSGSGPSVFGIFTDEAAAERVKDALREEKCYAYVTRPWR